MMCSLSTNNTEHKEMTRLVDNYRKAVALYEEALKVNAELNAVLEQKTLEIESRTSELNAENEELSSLLESLDSSDSPKPVIEEEQLELDEIPEPKPEPKAKPSLKDVVRKKKQEISVLVDEPEPSSEIDINQLHEESILDAISGLEEMGIDDDEELERLVSSLGY